MPSHPLILRIVAMIFSVILHPLFIPVIAVAYMMYIQRSPYTGISMHDRGLILARVVVNTVFFPFVTVLLLRGAGFIKSIFLRTRKERIIPYVATNIFYFWMYLVFRNQPMVPGSTTAFILGIFIASSAGLLCNAFFKISMHAIAMGTFCGLLLAFIFLGNVSDTFLPLMVLILLSGIVLTSRLILSDHNLFEIGSGFLVGLICMLCAAWIYIL